MTQTATRGAARRKRHDRIRLHLAGTEARPRLADPAQCLEQALMTGHAASVREAQKQDLPEHPRTVIAASVVHDGRVHWTQVGDCRIYLLRAGRSDAEISSAVAQLWRVRADRYSETRTINTSGIERGDRKVEMSYIGG